MPDRAARSVTDDDGKTYVQQLNCDGNWSEWHDGDWPGDANTAFLVAPLIVGPAVTPAPPEWSNYLPVTVPPGVTVTGVTTNIPATKLTAGASGVTTNIPATKLTADTYYINTTNS